MLKRSEVKKPSEATTQAAAPPAPNSPPPGSLAEQASAAQASLPKPASEPKGPTPPNSDPAAEGDQVTVCYGEDKYSPVQYNSFSHGPFFVQTKVRPGETHADAASRAWNACLSVAKGAYPGKEQAYLDNLRKLGIKVGA